MLSTLRSWSTTSFLIVALLASVVLTLTNFSVSNVGAAPLKTVEECYARDGFTPGEDFVSCVDQGFCTIVNTTDGLRGTTQSYKCKTPEQARLEGIDPVVNATNTAQVRPVIDLICKGRSEAVGAYAKSEYTLCAEKVRAAYDDCSSKIVNTRDPATTIANCMEGKGFTYLAGGVVYAEEIKKAIETGTVDAIAKAEELTRANDKAACDAKGDGFEFKDGACVDVKAASDQKCTGGSLGWFLCPVLEMFGSAVATSAEIIEQQLLIQPLVTSNGTTAMRAIWSVVVGFANLALVIAFLIVIFSQATSFGLSAYGIKKMLPRIIVAAVLINLSFFICGIAIDIFNVIGASIKGLMQTGIDTVTATSSAKGTGFVGFVIASSMWLVATVGVVVVASAIGIIGFVLPVIVAGAMAILTVVVIVALRHVLVILLIIVSPLAFAAMILPGTEPYFKKWYQSFGKLLVMYPVIMAILYGSALASAIILATASAIK